MLIMVEMIQTIAVLDLGGVFKMNLLRFISIRRQTPISLYRMEKQVSFHMFPSLLEQNLRTH